MKRFMLSCTLLLIFCQMMVQPLCADTQRPNILWIYLEDMSRWFGCYGDKLAKTPHLDALAGQGVRFDRFYTCAGVCSAMRSGTITGMMQTSLNIHHHRSHRGFKYKQYHDHLALPAGIKTVPEYFRDAGYWTFNDGKDDFNFAFKKKDLYDSYGKMNFQGNEWDDCPEGKPFFGQIQLWGGKDKPKISPDKKVKMSEVTVPPYYPDIPLVRKEIAHHYDCVHWVDIQVGRIMAKLKSDGLLEKTYVILVSDHGYKLHRDKQYLYEGGINMPFFISGPGIEPGQVRDDLVSSIDMGPTSLALAGIAIPEHMEGQAVMAEGYEPKPYVVSARDRCGIAVDHIRAIVTPRFKYLKNYFPERSFMQPSYKDSWAVSKAFRQLMKEKKVQHLPGGFFKDRRPAEELYDLTKDPMELNNLATDPAYKAELEKHRVYLAEWIRKTDDKGQYPERIDSLMAVYAQHQTKCVNPEYEKVKPLIDLTALKKRK